MGLVDMRSVDSPCTFKEVSIDQEEYPKAAQMALEIYVCILHLHKIFQYLDLEQELIPYYIQ